VNRLSGFAVFQLQDKFGGGDRREIEAMKIFTVVAVALLALMAMPAQAQFKKGGAPAAEKKPDARQKTEDEKAYKAALEKIPESKEKYDPWGVARPADSAKKPK
jgi:hypothetical protein